jgi:hypothetical protein
VESALPAVAIIIAAWLGLRSVHAEVGRALAILVAGALLAALYLRMRGEGELFYFKDLSFTGPLIVMLAVVAIATRLPRVAGAVALLVLLALLADGTRRELGVTYDQATTGLLELREWDRELPDRSIRIDVPPSGWQLWSWYFLPRHRVSAPDPLGGFFPHPPKGRRADLVLVQRGQRRPRDAVGAPVRENAEYVLYRLRPGLPGRDVSSRALVFDVTEITL